MYPIHLWLYIIIIIIFVVIIVIIIIVVIFIVIIITIFIIISIIVLIIVILIQFIIITIIIIIIIISIIIIIIIRISVWSVNMYKCLICVSCWALFYILHYLIFCFIILFKPLYFRFHLYFFSTAKMIDGYFFHLNVCFDLSHRSQLKYQNVTFKSVDSFI